MPEVADLKKIIVLLIALSLSAGTAFSHEDGAFQEAKYIIKSKVTCSKLTEEQLERLGDYYMEQMHPGEAHEAMDEMMGGEGSESLRQVHIAMAKRIYCNDVSGTVQYGMMGMMGMGRWGMTGGNMMGYGLGSGGFGSGMMGGALGYTAINSLFWILSLALIAAIVFLIVKSNKNPKENKMKNNMDNGNAKLWLLIAAVIVLLILNFGNYGMMGYGMGFGFGWLFMISFLVLVVWLIMEILSLGKGKRGGKK